MAYRATTTATARASNSNDVLEEARPRASFFHQNLPDFSPSSLLWGHVAREAMNILISLTVSLSKEVASWIHDIVATLCSNLH